MPDLFPAKPLFSGITSLICTAPFRNTGISLKVMNEYATPWPPGEFTKRGAARYSAPVLHVRNEEVLPHDRPAPAAAPTAPAPAGARDPYFDNAKYLAILLVAIGHAWTPLLSDSRAATALYMFVYAFHMPAFIMIAGYFSRSFTGRPDQLKRLITGIGAPRWRTSSSTGRSTAPTIRSACSIPTT
jgi:hypothetical protein